MNKKTLELDGDIARRLYPTASSELKEILEQNFGKEFFSQKITDRVKDYRDVLNILGLSESSDDSRVEGFSDAENKVNKAFIKKMRICKVLNEGWIPRRGEERWYCWFDVSSGFAFASTYYGDTIANADSASRLCFKNRQLAEYYGRVFLDVERDLVDLA